jgi:Glycine-zipper domain
MKLTVFFSVVIAAAIASNNATAQTKSERCEAYARNAAGSTPTTTGVARGAARGAVVGSISGNAGRGAGVGAVVGGTRRVAQRSRSYQSYYDACMRQ